MKKILIVDCCLRGENSRTRRMLTAFEGGMSEGYRLERICLNETELAPLNGKTLQKREDLLAAGDFGHTMFEVARQFSQADMVVVAAPFWDMGIPAKLKTYFEHVSCSGIAFTVTEGMEFKGLCRATDMVYLTTRGMDIADGAVMEQASPYLRAVSTFFGIERFHMVSAWGLDVITPGEAEERLRIACCEAAELAKSL